MTQAWTLGKVALKVNDLEKMTQFYQEIMGTSILAQTDNSVTLGVKETGEALFELIKINPAAEKKVTAGLYHHAVLLPTRSDLGEFLYNLLVKKYPLGGASDHGYSEAIYFNDPEGNGVEVYADKNRSEWDIREDGRIEGITIQMDAEGVLGSVKKPFSGLPAGTIMGHVHLTVRDLVENGEFYTNIIGLGLKSDYFGQAKFFASGDYHHHVGSNTWAGKLLPQPEEDQLGMAYYTWVLPNQDELVALKGRFDQNGISYEEEAGVLKAKDTNGILMHIIVK
ncbi:MAG TPA: VOC family protein [Candidatus Jeotgalibaca merdavium]|uniref:VOC family protein n=1 Tax=Candidatus Jeotgalibaca merdavium TaxID=2838627 RepID=A0A9D2HZV1_9LACT|nr:VOC family protein [Candidatus Jeotgalibaca merdavium]